MQRKKGEKSTRGDHVLESQKRTHVPREEGRKKEEKIDSPVFLSIN